MPGHWTVGRRYGRVTELGGRRAGGPGLSTNLDGRGRLKYHQNCSVSSLSQAQLQTIKVAVGTCLVIPPGPWPLLTTEGRGAQATWQPPLESLPSKPLPSICQTRARRPWPLQGGWWQKAG